LSDCTVRENPLPGSLIVTFAPGTAAPEGSVTVPDKLPTFCARAVQTITRHEINVSTKINFAEDQFIDRPFRAPYLKLRYTLAGNTKPTQKQCGALLGLNLEKFDLEQLPHHLKQPLT